MPMANKRADCRQCTRHATNAHDIKRVDMNDDCSSCASTSAASHNEARKSSLPIFAVDSDLLMNQWNFDEMRRVFEELTEKPDNHRQGRHRCLRLNTSGTLKAHRNQQLYSLQTWKYRTNLRHRLPHGIVKPRRAFHDDMVLTSSRRPHPFLKRSLPPSMSYSHDASSLFAPNSSRSSIGSAHTPPPTLLAQNYQKAMSDVGDSTVHTADLINSSAESQEPRFKRSSSLSCLHQPDAACSSRLATIDDEVLANRSINDLSAEQTELNIPHFFDRSQWRVQSAIGAGYFGDAYKVEHVITHETAVMKRLCRLEESSLQSFFKSALFYRQLCHAHVLKCIGVFFEDRNTLNLVLEYIDGGTLRQLLCDSSTTLPYSRRVNMSKGIADGMAYLHSMAIIHKNLSADNILLRAHGQSVVADFGLIKSGNRLTGAHWEWYVAPEVVKRQVYDERVDIYSFGVLLFELIARVNASSEKGFQTGGEWGIDESTFIANNDVAACPKPLFRLALRCIAIEAAKRPCFGVLFDWLCILHSQLDEDTSPVLRADQAFNMLSLQIEQYIAPPIVAMRAPVEPMRSFGIYDAISEQSSVYPPPFNRRASFAYMQRRRRPLSVDLGYGSGSQSDCGQVLYSHQLASGSQPMSTVHPMTPNLLTPLATPMSDAQSTPLYSMPSTEEHYRASSCTSSCVLSFIPPISSTSSMLLQHTTSSPFFTTQAPMSNTGDNKTTSLDDLMDSQ